MAFASFVSFSREHRLFRVRPPPCGLSSCCRGIRVRPGGISFPRGGRPTRARHHHRARPAHDPPLSRRTSRWRVVSRIVSCPSGSRRTIPRSSSLASFGTSWRTPGQVTSVSLQGRARRVAWQLQCPRSVILDPGRPVTQRHSLPPKPAIRRIEVARDEAFFWETRRPAYQRTQVRQGER